MKLGGILLGVALLEMVGCYRTDIIPGPEVPKINDCIPEKDCFLSDGAGHTVPVDATTDVTIVRDGRPMSPRKFTSMAVQSGVFVGVTTFGERIEIPIGSIQQLELRHFSGGRTGAAAFAPILVVLALLLAVVIGCSIARCSPG